LTFTDKEKIMRTILTILFCLMLTITVWFTGPTGDVEKAEAPAGHMMLRESGAYLYKEPVTEMNIAAWYLFVPMDRILKIEDDLMKTEMTL